MGRKERSPVSLKLRVVGNLLLLAAMAALVVGIIRFPGWKLERELCAAMEDDGLTGPGELLWRGEVYDGTGWHDTSIWLNGERLYASWLGSYYGGHVSARVDRGALPGGPAVFPCNANMSWSVVQTRKGERIYQLMAANLPEAATGGRLTVTLIPGAAARTAEGEREGQVILFRPSGDWLNVDVRSDTDWNQNYFPTGLEGLPYTLTLWDGSGTVISETAGTLGSVWGR